LSAGILQRRFVVPLKGVLDDAFNRVPRLVEKGAVADAEGSLANMLEDFLEENDSRKKGGKSSKTTKEERRKLAETLNPALISTAYEEELKKNVVKNFLNGKTARLVLIQVMVIAVVVVVAVVVMVVMTVTMVMVMVIVVMMVMEVMVMATQPLLGFRNTR
jgi:hypothetical protein